MHTIVIKVRLCEVITIEIYSSMVTKQNGYHMFEVSEHSRNL